MSIKNKDLNQFTPTLLRIIGAMGALVCIIFFALAPSFPTPDKILIFLTFVFMAFGQATEMLKRLVPFVVLLLVYESFRGIAHELNNHVNYTWMPMVDQKLFGGTLPTITFQHWLWHGHVMWYDFIFYIFYMLHFVFPFALAILIWKKRDYFYWRFMTSYVVMSFAGFLTYLLFPAAPPWMASDYNLIPHITRISGYVWGALGIQNFSLVYRRFAPNPVAAVPSLHAAYSTMFVIMIFKLFGKKWGLLACIYPLILWFGVIYLGEHYAIDVILGIIYAFASFFATQWAFDYFAKRKKNKPTHKRLSPQKVN